MDTTGYRLTARGWAALIVKKPRAERELEKLIDTIIKEAYRRGFDEGWAAKETNVVRPA